MDYKRGLTELKTRIRTGYPDFLVEFSTLEARLLDNLSSEQRFGTNETLRSDRAKVVAELNRMAFDTIGISFNELCIKDNAKPHHIVVTGGAEASSLVKELARAIGYEVVKQGHILLNGGAKGVDQAAVHGADDYIAGLLVKPLRAR